MTDVLLWAADQGSLGNELCRRENRPTPERVRERVLEISVRATNAPERFLRPDDPHDGDLMDEFIGHMLDRQEGESEQDKCLNDELFALLDQLICSYGFPVANGLDTPVDRRQDIDYICRFELNETIPPEWARYYFDNR
jgi:hypothetical protein